MLLNALGFVLVVVLGFLPLIVIRWVEWRPLLKLPRLSGVPWHAVHPERTALVLLALMLWMLMD